MFNLNNLMTLFMAVSVPLIMVMGLFFGSALAKKRVWGKIWEKNMIKMGLKIEISVIIATFIVIRENPFTVLSIAFLMAQLIAYGLKFATIVSEE